MSRSETEQRLQQKGRLYLGFTSDTPARVARERFLQRYGVEPQEVTSGLGLVWAGPVPEKGN